MLNPNPTNPNRPTKKTENGPGGATGKMRMCGHADLWILERVRVKIMDLH